MADIANDVSREYGVALSEMRDNHRYKRDSIEARKAAVRAMHAERPDLTSGEIAMFMRVDSSTVRRYLRLHKKRVRARKVEFATPDHLSQHAKIIHDVARKHNVLPSLIMSNVRAVPIVAARHEAIARVYQEVVIGGKPPSLNRLGTWFDRDHTAILHALTKSGLKPPKGQRVGG